MGEGFAVHHKVMAGGAQALAGLPGQSAALYVFCTDLGQPLAQAPAWLRAVAAAARRHAAVLSSAQQQVNAANALAEQATPEAVPSAVASADSAGSSAQDEVKTSGDRETGEVEETTAWYAGWWEKSEPVREYIEATLAPFDIVAADHWIDALENAAGQPSEWIDEVDKLIGNATKLRSAGKPAIDAIKAAAEELESVGNKLDAWDAFAPGWLKTAAGGIAEGAGWDVSGLGTTDIKATDGAAPVGGPFCALLAASASSSWPGASSKALPLSKSPNAPASPATPCAGSRPATSASACRLSSASPEP